MLRALTLASALALCAGAAFAQTSYPMPQDYPAAGQGAAPGAGYGGQPGYGQDNGGYGAQGAGPNGGGYGGQGGGYGQGAGGYGGQGYGPGGGGRDPQMRALRQQMRAACATDISTYCAEAGQGGHGALHQCMTANAARFSQPCLSAMGALRSYNQQKRANGGGRPGYAAPGYGAPTPGGYPAPQESQQPPPQ